MENENNLTGNIAKSFYTSLTNNWQCGATSTNSNVKTVIQLLQTRTTLNDTNTFIKNRTTKSLLGLGLILNRRYRL